MLQTITSPSFQPLFFFCLFHINVLSSINWVFLRVGCFLGLFFFFLWHCADYLTCSKAVSPSMFERISGGPFWQWLSIVLKDHLSDGHYHYYCITVHRLDIATFSSPAAAQSLPRSPCSGVRVCLPGGLKRCTAMGISLIGVSNECSAVGICEYSSPPKEAQITEKIPVQTLQLFKRVAFFHCTYLIANAFSTSRRIIKAGTYGNYWT